MSSALALTILHQSDLFALYLFLSIFYSSKEFRSLYTLDSFHQMLLSLVVQFSMSFASATLVFRPALADSLHIISHPLTFVNTFFQLFLSFFRVFFKAILLPQHLVFRCFHNHNSFYSLLFILFSFSPKYSFFLISLKKISDEEQNSSSDILLFFKF